MYDVNVLFFHSLNLINQDIYYSAMYEPNLVEKFFDLYSLKQVTIAFFWEIIL